MAGGMPLAFTQEDFLVFFVFAKSFHLRHLETTRNCCQNSVRFLLINDNVEHCQNKYRNPLEQY